MKNLTQVKYGYINVFRIILQVVWWISIVLAGIYFLVNVILMFTNMVGGDIKVKGFIIGSAPPVGLRYNVAPRNITLLSDSANSIPWAGIGTLDIENHNADYIFTGNVVGLGSFNIVPKTPSAWGNWGLLSFFVSYLLVVLLPLYLLKQIINILKSLKGRGFFDEINFKRIRIIGFGYIALFFIQIFGSMLNTHFLMKSISITNFNLTYDIGITHALPDLIFGFLILLLGEFFKIGLQLQKDKDLTI